MSKFMSMLIAVLLALCLLAERAEAKTASARLETEVAPGAFVGRVEDHLEGVLRTETVMAATTEASSARWDEVSPLLERFSQDLPTDATVWFMIPDGSYSSNAYGGLTDQNLRDRAYYPQLMAGKTVLGDLAISKSPGKRSIIVTVQVLADGKVVSVVGVSVDTVNLAGVVDSGMRLPENAWFYALDANTQIVLHCHQAGMFKTVAEVGDESLGDAFRLVMNKDRGVFSYSLSGKKMASIFRKSSLSGWYFLIAQECK